MTDFNSKVDLATRFMVDRMTQEELAEALLVCVWEPPEKRSFPDNIEGKCHDCGTPIVYRPHAERIPKKVCIPCMKERTQGGHA